MHYFTFGERIAAVEDAAQAARYKAAGWRAVPRAIFIAAWRERDMSAYAAMWEELVRQRLSAPLGREVGATALPHGYVYVKDWN